MRRPKDCPPDLDLNHLEIRDVLKFLGRDPVVALPRAEEMLTVVPVSEQEYHSYVEAVRMQNPKEWWTHPHRDYMTWVGCAKEGWNETAEQIRPYEREERARQSAERIEAQQRQRVEATAVRQGKAEEDGNSIKVFFISDLVLYTTYAFRGERIEVHITNLILLFVGLGILKLLWSCLRRFS